MNSIKESPERILFRAMPRWWQILAIVWFAGLVAIGLTALFTKRLPGPDAVFFAYFALYGLLVGYRIYLIQRAHWAARERP